MVLAGLCGQRVKGAKEAALDQAFSLKHGQAALIKAAGLKIRFTAVIEDSRCPQGEQCIRAGNAKVELELKHDKEKPMIIRLDTAAGLQEATYQGYTVKLVSLDPYPKASAAIRPADYTATVVVHKQESGV